ncbi:P-loop NTPase fold protein [Streptomyces sp. HPF1205]|uniref:P-loop NTPase fold protein n=1 Tax=Streptomyces sp. HPF1205 TaxID=2873262 RepID=UPI001CED8108|nr:P-loop NTPase fold protein [Streptomyces sp. HPF1205]
MSEPSSQRFSLLNDEPVATAATDLLGASRAAKELAGLLVASRGSTPFTLAVDAGWGTGKSSLMHLVDTELAQATDVYTVWYNAWTSTGADALEGLIKSVLMRFDRRVLRRALQRVSDSRALVRVARALTMLVTGPLGVAGLADELWKSFSVSPQARNEMQKEIKELTQEWAETSEFSPQRLLVVFIDDLDRCSEKTVLAICEAVKVYLDVPGLAFVIGCDRSALGPSGLLRDLSPAGSAFMEKIFQTTYRVPVPDETGIEDFVRRCAQESGIQALLNADLVSLIADRSGRNPRRIKKLINGFVLEIRLNPLWRDFGPQAVDAVIRTLLLQHLYPDFYRMLIGSGTAYGDVLVEFLEYRQVRRALRQIADDGSNDVDLARFFVEHEVRPPAEEDPDHRGALAELESQLPSGFPALASDRGFTSLIEDLMALPQAEELIQRLRQQRQPLSGPAESAVALEAVPDSPEWPAPDDGRARAEQPLGGMRILWIDDMPEGVEHEARMMRREGAHVAVVKDRAEAEWHLSIESHDLLISDITRGTDYDAGFDDLERLRGGGLYSGPVVFYTGRVTPAREARAAELRALGVTASARELHQLVARAARLRTSQ